MTGVLGKEIHSEDVDFEVIHSDMNFFRKMIQNEKRNEKKILGLSKLKGRVTF